MSKINLFDNDFELDEIDGLVKREYENKIFTLNVKNKTANGKAGIVHKADDGAEIPLYEGKFKDGYPAGKQSFYHKNSKPKATFRYNKDGLLHGKYKVFDEEGKEIYSANYKNGLIHGEEKMVNPKGEKKSNFYIAGNEVSNEKFKAFNKLPIKEKTKEFFYNLKETMTNPKKLAKQIFKGIFMVAILGQFGVFGLVGIISHKAYKKRAQRKLEKMAKLNDFKIKDVPKNVASEKMFEKMKEEFGLVNKETAKTSVKQTDSATKANENTAKETAKKEPIKIPTSEIFNPEKLQAFKRKYLKAEKANMNTKTKTKKATIKLK